MNVIKVQERKDIGINLHPMKKIEIIVSGEHEQLISSMMEEAKVTGFTLLRNISGKGHNGFHEGKILFNDRASLIMFLAVAPEEVIATLALGMKTLFQQNSGVMFVSDVDVARMDYFHSTTGA
ncbi:transcriptional regulator [Legionella qingyii]|uniref:P-II family nitrogen regulator n=1 Tax=Legionella qingyii TaxID=2184757 RepID=A0A317TXP7_9GAMM|nr:P-II family nitrogen regulator [Legionella qingyii]PWY54344.1 transcriptional regulator [Legionella qingyii]RUR24113.1 P-II family nitrogen regulator [Legionella qingyii]RUR24286.1 P-II family nitrogen regulator [Legionella qingyii]